MSQLLSEKVDFSILFRVPAERVYDALATAAGLDEWFTSGAEVDARAGGEIHFRWQNWGLENYSGENSGTVLAARRPTRFAFMWKADSGTYNTKVEINFSEVEEGTLVRLIESGYEATTAGMQDLLNRTSGWAHVLTLMKFYLEHSVKY